MASGALPVAGDGTVLMPSTGAAEPGGGGVAVGGAVGFGTGIAWFPMPLGAVLLLSSSPQRVSPTAASITAPRARARVAFVRSLIIDPPCLTPPIVPTIGLP